MALAPCVDCGHQFSDAAKACPSCGRPTEATSQARRNAGIAAGLIAALVVAVLVAWVINSLVVAQT